VPVGQALVRAGRREDDVLVVGAAHELDARGYSGLREAVGHGDGGKPRDVPDGPHEVLGPTPDGTAKLFIQS